jgi:DNA-binding NarL/FixJ family response regulator
MIRVLLVDDQILFRQGLASLLTLEPDLQVIGQANDGQEAIAWLDQANQSSVVSSQSDLHLPDVILMDVRMPVCDGVTATQEIHCRYPQIRVLVLTTFDEDEYVWRSLKAGASGYLLKNTPSEQVAAAIRTVHQGHSQLGPTIAQKVFTQLFLREPPQANYQDGFSDRELDVLLLLAQGMSNREIAQHLHITEGTVKNRLTRILSQLGLRDRTQAALWAQQHLL